MDNYDAGRMCGKLVKEALPKGGNVVILVGRIEQDNARRRRQGLIDELLDRPSDPQRFDPPGRQVKGGKFNKQIVLPPYIHDVAKVQIWCAWAGVLLGEATFDSPVR